MEILQGILVVLHIVGFALVFGGALGQLPNVKKGMARVQPFMLWGALLLLVTGLALVGMTYALGGQPNNMKIGVKLIVLLALIGHIFGVRKKESLSAGGLTAMAGMALVNASIAVLWH
ncbi:hypothetical protein [Leucobacter sp. gxy201]|uniref:hypothetical protein n=1 Tax=Leucobacter sp. gxy201 TaxID=2957200 RepID=UPI003D9FCEDB